MTNMVLVPRGALNAMLGYIEVASHAIELGHVGAKCCGDLKAALSAAPPAVGREEIARIIHTHVRGNVVTDHRGYAIPGLGLNGVSRAADAILTKIKQ